MRLSGRALACPPLLLALCSPVSAQQFCPPPPYPEGCLSLAVGDVSIQSVHPGQEICVQPGGSAQTLMAIPLNTSGASLPADVSVSSVTPVVKTASAAPSGGLPLAALAELPPAGWLDGQRELKAAEAQAELSALLAGGPRDEVLIPPGRGKFSAGVPVVDAIIDVQVAPGCSGAPDIRKARVEAVSPAVAGKQRMYVLQEVVDGGGGTWVPAMNSSLTRTDFENVAVAYNDAFDSTTVTFGGTSIPRTGVRDVLETNFGAIQDVDGNGGVFAFFTRRMNEATPPATSGFIAARFEARDLLSSSACGRSNEGEIIYLGLPDPTGAVNSNVRTVSSVAGGLMRAMAHQMTRLTAAGRRLYVQLAAIEEPWLDETLAWMSTDLLFFSTSVGLTPRSNIVLSDLTTGPNASRRVAAFNAYENLIYSALRNSFLSGSGSTPAGRYSLLTNNPPNSTVFETENERISYFYGATAAFLRYALDRRNGDDAAGLRSLVDTDLTGVANLQNVFAADIVQWLQDFGVAMAADDLVAVESRFTTPSWNYRSVFGGLGGYPLSSPTVTAASSPQPVTLGGEGGLLWLTFGVPSGTNGVDPASTLRYAVGPTAPMSPLKIAVVRTQ